MNYKKNLIILLPVLIVLNFLLAPLFLCSAAEFTGGSYDGYTKIDATEDMYNGGSYDGHSASAVSGDVGLGFGQAAKLYFRISPSTSSHLNSFQRQPVVEVQDASGNIVTSDSSSQVTISIGNNPGAGVLRGTATVTVSSGVAVFAGLLINRAGEMYTLVAAASGLEAATSDAFDILPSTGVQAHAFWNGTNYTIEAWVAADDNMLATLGGGSSCAVTVDTLSNQAMGQSGNKFTYNWTPSDYSKSYSAYISLYETTAGTTYARQFQFSTVKYDTKVINWTDITTIKSSSDTINWSDIAAIKAKTDTINWTDISAVKTAVGVGEAKTVWERAGDILILLGNYDDTSTDDTVFGKIADLKKTIWTDNLAKVNWTDIGALSDQGINWTDLAVMTDIGINWSDIDILTKAGVNWDDINILTRIGINWMDIELLGEAGINWDDLNIMTKAGINWMDIDILTVAGVNWADLYQMTIAGVNWNDIAYMSGAGVNWDETINWDNLAELSNSGVNWEDIAVMSDEGINWASIDNLSEAGVNWEDFEILTKAGINWSDFKPLTTAGINWSDLGILSQASINWDDLDIMTRAGINWADIGILSGSGINWEDIQIMAQAGVNWDDLEVLSKIGINWLDFKPLTTAGINWSDLGILSQASINWDDLD
ncbi:MAG: hypothetical protein ABH858_06175, partial [Candidatus Omnitrophota bacterium]